MSTQQPRDDRTILVVNDNDAARYVMLRMLERSGFAARSAATAAEAMQEIAARPLLLVVLDIQLPDMSGLEVCRRIKADPATQHLKVLHTSAVYVATDSKVHSLESGADGYLSQPFEQEELIATVRSLIRLSETEQALRDRADELDQSNRRTHEFLAMLAHELRNPLAAIVASLPTIERHAPADDAERTAREVMRRQGSRLARLVDALLDVARVTQGKIDLALDTVNLTDVVMRVADDIRKSTVLPRRQTLEVSVPPHPLPLRADETRLEQIVANLLDNASKYTDPGGSIRVELAYDEATGSASFVVRDSGIGIPQEGLTSIFDLFSQVDVSFARSRGGLGVGLTLVRRLVELHGGTVRAASAGIGTGSEFVVTLPLLEKPAASAPMAPRAAGLSGAPCAAKRILLVEDNRDAQMALSMLLEIWGHAVEIAEDGPTGIAAAVREMHDIAFIDLGLPGVDGFEVARRIRAAPGGGSIALVALTGYGAAADRDNALAAGFDLHVVKPIDPEELLRLVSGDPAAWRADGSARAGVRTAYA